MYSAITYITVVITIHCEISLSTLTPLLPPPPPPVPNALLSETDLNVKENSFVFKVNEPPLHDQRTESNAANPIVKVRKNSFAYKANEKPPTQKAIKEEYSNRKSTTVINGVNIWKPNKRKIQNKNYDDSTSERLTYNQVDRGQPGTSDETKKHVQDEKNLQEPVPGSKSQEAVSDIDLLQALLKLMPKKNRKNVIKKIVNTFIFTSHGNNTNVKSELSTTTTATPTIVKTKEPLNNADEILEPTDFELHKNSDLYMKRKNRRDRDFKEIEEVKLATTDNPQTPTEVTETDLPYLKEENFKHKHTNTMNKKNRKKFRRRYNNFHGRNRMLMSSKINRAKQIRESKNDASENLKSKFGFSGQFEKMYRRLFGKRHLDASTTTTTTATTLLPDNSFTTMPPDYFSTTPPPDYFSTTPPDYSSTTPPPPDYFSTTPSPDFFSTTPPPDYFYEDTTVPVDYDYINSEDPRRGQENRQKYRDLAKSKYNWNRQSSKESFNQYQDVEKIDFPTEHDKRYNKRLFRRKQKSGPGWNIRPRNIHRTLHISSKIEAPNHWRKKSNDERLESTDLQNENYIPYDFERGEMRGKSHNINSQKNNIKRKLTKVRNMKKSPKNSKKPKENKISVQSAEFIISEPRVQRVPQTKIYKKNIVMPSQYDFEAPSHTLHESSKFRRLNNFELKNKSHSDDVKSSVRVDSSFLLTKMVQEAVHKALANLHLVGQSNANVLSEPNFSPQVTDDIKNHPKAKKTTLGFRKSVDIDKKSAFAATVNISPRNNGYNNDRFQWLDPVSVANPDEKSNTSKEVTNAETMKSSQHFMKAPFEFSPPVNYDSKTHPEASRTALGFRKSVDIDKKSVSLITDNILPRNDANNKVELQWIDPVSVVKPVEKSKTSKEVTNAETMTSLPYVMNVVLEYPENVPTTPRNVFPSWITRKTFTRRTSGVKRRKSQSVIPQHKPSAMSDKKKTNKRSMYYTWRNGKLVSVKTVKAPRYSGQNKKNKSKESKNLSAQKGATTISPNVDSPYFDYALPTTDPLAW